MMILLQLVLFCLYFDPKDYIEKAVELGIVDKIRKFQHELKVGDKILVEAVV